MIAGIAVVLLVVFMVGSVGTVKVSDWDVGWLAGTTPVAADEAHVYRRYLLRLRRHRLVGGLFGAAFAVVLGLSWYGWFTVGIGQGNPLADVLFCGLAGVQIAMLSAETFRLRAVASPLHVASLAPRPAPPHDLVVWGPWAVTLAAIAVGVGFALAGDGLVPAAIALGGVVFGGVKSFTQRAITSRRRPVMSDAAHRVDGRLRIIARRSVDLTNVATSVLTLGWTLSKLPQSRSPVVEIGRFFAVTGCLVVVIVTMRRCAPRAPLHWRPGAP